MLRLTILFLTVFVVACFLLPLPLKGYGPNVIDSDGDVVVWDQPVIFDEEADLSLESCGQSLSGFVSGAFDTWSAAPEASLTTTGRSLGVAVDADNVCDYLYDVSACPNGPTSGPPTGGVNPIVFDEDGGITVLFFGVGNRYRTLGFAGIISYSVSTNRAVKGEGVINVACLDGCSAAGCPQTFSEDDVRSFIVHEGGHFLGMNHTQVNIDESDSQYTQTMFALFSTGAGADIRVLNRDDEVGIANLYPDPAGSLTNNFCTVTGTVTDENGDEFQCANVIARNTDTTGNKNLLDAISFVSGGDKTGGTSASGRGDFTIKGLTPGETYQIDVEPISTDGQLSAPSSGIIPCNGGNGNPSAPTFDEQTLSQTVTCSSGGDTTSAGTVQLSNTSGNVSDGDDDDDDDDDGGGSSSGGCSLLPR